MSKAFVIPFVILTLLVLSSPAPAQQSEGFQVIVHPSNPVASLTAKQASRYFLKATKTWQDGRTVMPVDLPAGSPVRAEFSKGVHGKTARAIEGYWQQQVFSGRTTVPTQKMSDSEVLAYVRSNSGAIGYVSASADTSGVKVVSISQ